MEVTDQGEYASTVSMFSNNKVLSQSIHLKGSPCTVIANVPYEVTHALLTHHLGRPLPRWAEAGTAALTLSASCQSRCDQWVRENRGGRCFVPLGRLLSIHDIPWNSATAVYDEGCSLTNFLVRIGGRAKYLAFVAAGERDGWDKAADAQYGYGMVEELERAWLTRIRDGEASEGRNDDKTDRE